MQTTRQDVNNLRLRRRPRSRRVIKPASPWSPLVPLSAHPTTLRPPSVRGNVRLYMYCRSLSDRSCDRTEEGRLDGNSRSPEKFDEKIDVNIANRQAINAFLIF